MARDESGRLTKQARNEQRRRAAQLRRRLSWLRRTGIAAAVLALPALWVLDCSGAQERVEAEVIETRLWRHYANNGTSHSHTAATLRIEGLSETTVRRADGFERGQRVPVWVRRGRISGWPYFLDLAKPGEIEWKGGRAEDDEGS